MSFAIIEEIHEGVAISLQHIHGEVWVKFIDLADFGDAVVDLDPICVLDVRIQLRNRVLVDSIGSGQVAEVEVWELNRSFRDFHSIQIYQINCIIKTASLPHFKFSQP